jgi:hypothetical protein
MAMKRAPSKLGYGLRRDPDRYRQVVENAAATAGGNVRRMAWILGCARQRLYVLLRIHRLWGVVNRARRERADRLVVERRNTRCKNSVCAP